MANPTAVQRGERLWFWCPGCDDLHCVTDKWEWDIADLDQVTVSPSILVSGTQWEPSAGFHKPNHAVAPGTGTICHSFLRAGRWEFLTDSTHHLAGQTVDMVPLPDWFLEEA